MEDGREEAEGPERVFSRRFLRADPRHTWSFLLPGGCRLCCAGFSCALPRQLLSLLRLPVLGAGPSSELKRRIWVQ